jgi:hypothetical protein
MPKYYIIWVEGLWPKTGEKIKSLTVNDQGKIEIEYTTKMTESLRVRAEHKELFQKKLDKYGMTCTVTYNERSWIPASYAPARTTWNPYKLKKVNM